MDVIIIQDQEENMSVAGSVLNSGTNSRQRTQRNQWSRQKSEQKKMDNNDQDVEMVGSLDLRRVTMSKNAI